VCTRQTKEIVRRQEDFLTIARMKRLASLRGLEEFLTTVRTTSIFRASAREWEICRNRYTERRLFSSSFRTTTTLFKSVRTRRSSSTLYGREHIRRITSIRTGKTSDLTLCLEPKLDVTPMKTSRAGRRDDSPSLQEICLRRRRWRYSSIESRRLR